MGSPASRSDESSGGCEPAGLVRRGRPARARVLELACARMPHSSTMADLNNLFGDLQGKGHIHVSYSVSSGQGASAAALGNGQGPVKKCVGCNLCFPKDNFFKKQWKGAENRPDRRCKDCHQKYHTMQSKQKSNAQKASNKLLGGTKKERALAERQRQEYERQRREYERQWQRSEQRQRMLEEMSRRYDEEQRRKAERVREMEQRARRLQQQALANQARPVEHVQGIRKRAIDHAILQQQGLRTIWRKKKKSIGERHTKILRTIPAIDCRALISNLPSPSL